MVINHDIVNYVLYNYKDEPVDLCEELNISIYSFPIVLDADILQNQLYVKQINNQIISPEEHKLLCDKRNLVNIRTAKVHEYEALLIKELDDIADIFFTKTKNKWTEKKEILNQQVVQRFNEK